MAIPMYTSNNELPWLMQLHDRPSQREITDTKTRLWARMWPSETDAINQFRAELALPPLAEQKQP